MTLAAISSVDVTGKTLLVRADLNVPLDHGTVRDTSRIDRWATGMRPLLKRGTKLVILTHLGQPGGKIDPSLSVTCLHPLLSEALGCTLHAAGAVCGPAVERRARRLRAGEALLCENVRFHPGEEKNAPDLAAQFARLGDIFVNDAFSCAHRDHASITGVAAQMHAVAGPLMCEEIKALSAALEAPKRPSVAIVGGAKISTKIILLKHLVTRFDAIIIGGGMANSFLHAGGALMGRSLHEADQAGTVAGILHLARKAGCTVHLPRDVVVANAFRAGADNQVVDAYACPPEMMILDAGPQTITDFKDVLEHARTIVWNGPLGAFELPPFDRATMALAAQAAAVTRSGRAVSIAGGGDTLAALNAAGVTSDFSCVSTAGGAFLAWLQGDTLPGIAALSAAKHVA